MRSLLIACLLLVGCASGTDAGAGGTDVVGTWSVRATQIAPSLDITGEMRIDRQDGAVVSGEMETREEAPNGVVRNRAGSLTGRVFPDDAVDFDVFVDFEPRRLVGRLRGDSITGNWAQSTGGVPLSGAFTLKRVK